MRLRTVLVLAAAAVVVLVAALPLQALLADWNPGGGPLAQVGPESSPALEPAGTVEPQPTADGASEPTATPQPTATPEPTATPTPAPSQSLLEGKTWLTMYGRAWDVAPILGRLGFFAGPDEMAAYIAPHVKEIQALNGGKEVVPVIHPIYAMAIPCEPDNHCLLYLDTAGFDIVEEYIKPAAERGWQVVLDSQIGSSTPVEQVQRMIDRGYLDYPNVHVAIDPEFHVYPGEDLPGIPIGQIDASDVNKVQHMLDELVRRKNLPKKVLIVHHFGDPAVNDGNPFMITNKKTLETLPNVDLVLDADGFGGPTIKVKKYNLMLDHEEYPFIRFRAIKLFFFNPYEERHHRDDPVMTWPQVFGEEPTPGGVEMQYKPDIIIVA